MNRYVYGLVDPRDKRIRYVGQTNDPNRRLREHLKRANTKNSHKNNWIKELLSCNLSPDIVILEECTLDKVVEVEAKWISSIPNLTNVLDKGLSYAGHSAEVKKRISQRNSNHPMYGIPKSQEVKDKISATLKGRRPSDNTIKAVKEYAQSQGGHYIVTTPAGEDITVFNLSKFGRDNNLSSSHLISVASGNRKHHKGYKCRKS